ncbi:synaptojanin-2-binding protein [Sigmodon hispidus]
MRTDKLAEARAFRDPLSQRFKIEEGGKSYAGVAARRLIHLHLRGAPADPGLPPGQHSAMNGRVDYLVTEEEINLTRGPSGYAVSLRVQHRLPVQNGPVVHRGEGEPSGIPVAMVLLPVFALTMVAVWAFVRYRKQL